MHYGRFGPDALINVPHRRVRDTVGCIRPFPLGLCFRPHRQDFALSFGRSLACPHSDLESITIKGDAYELSCISHISKA